MINSKNRQHATVHVNFSSPCLFILTCLKREVLISCPHLIRCFGSLIKFLMEMWLLCCTSFSQVGSSRMEGKEFSRCDSMSKLISARMLRMKVMTRNTAGALFMCIDLDSVA